VFKTRHVLPLVSAERRTAAFISAAEGQTGQAQATGVWKIAEKHFVLAEKKGAFNSTIFFSE